MAAIRHEADAAREPDGSTPDALMLLSGFIARLPLLDVNVPARLPACHFSPSTARGGKLVSYSATWMPDSQFSNSSHSRPAGAG